MAKIKVLVVDDDPKIAEIHLRFINKIEGFDAVGMAISIAEAREMLEVFDPDLLLLDIYFPNENGIEFLWEIRALQKPVDVILITAAKEVKPLREAIRGGVFDYIIKPALFSRFQSTLHRYRMTHRKIESVSSIEQQDADIILNVQTKEKKTQEILPKGIDAISLGKIRQVFIDRNSEGIGAEEVGTRVGMSRSSARRYLEYLVETGWLSADINYGTVGRPERRFFKS
jgi:two-component system CitB family response regulator